MFMAGSMRPETGAARVLLIGFLLLILAAVSGYTAQLTSYLTRKQFSTVFRVCAQSCGAVRVCICTGICIDICKCCMYIWICICVDVCIYMFMYHVYVCMYGST